MLMVDVSYWLFFFFLLLNFMLMGMNWYFGYFWMVELLFSMSK